MSRRVKQINAGVVGPGAGGGNRNVSPAIADNQLKNYQASRFTNNAGNFTARNGVNQKKSLLYQESSANSGAATRTIRSTTRNAMKNGS